MSQSITERMVEENIYTHNRTHAISNTHAEGALFLFGSITYYSSTVQEKKKNGIKNVTYGTVLQFWRNGVLQMTFWRNVVFHTHVIQ
jgi:hypothetical protein